jgi:hypothetical protein
MEVELKKRATAELLTAGLSSPTDNEISALFNSSLLNMENLIYFELPVLPDMPEDSSDMDYDQTLEDAITGDFDDIRDSDFMDVLRDSVAFHKPLGI